MRGNEDSYNDAQASAAPNIFGQLRELITDALGYWELRRLFYNVLLALVVLGHLVVSWPGVEAVHHLRWSFGHERLEVLEADTGGRAFDLPEYVLPLVEDHPAWGPWSVKGGVLHAIAPASALSRVVALRVHLDRSSSTNGPLRVLPGTHDCGVLSHEAIQQLAESVRPIECACQAGSVVAMRPLLVHASSKAEEDRPRRVLHTEYAAAVCIDAGFELAVG